MRETVPRISLVSDLKKEWVMVVDPVAVVGILVGCATLWVTSRTLGNLRKSERREGLQQGRSLISECKHDLEQVTGKVPRLKQDWKSAFTMHGAYPGGRADLKQAELDAFGDTAKKLREQLDDLADQLKDKRDTELSIHLTLIEDLRNQSRDLRAEVQESWEEVLIQISDARK